MSNNNINVSITQYKIAVTLAAFGGGVSSLNGLINAITLAGGSNIIITQVGQTITISATGGSGGVTSLNSLVGAVSIIGGQNIVVSQNGNGIHIAAFDGVSSINGLSGTIEFLAGSGIAISKMGQSIIIENEGGGGGSPGGSQYDVQTNDGAGGFAGDDTFVHKSGQVGIGTANPQALLDIESAINPQGKYWTVRSLPPNSNSINGFAYGAGVWVAVGNNGTIYTTTDLNTWTKRTSPTTDNWISVTYDSTTGLFVAVPSGGQRNTMTSPDGITWTGHSNAMPVGNWLQIISNNGTFVAVSFASTFREATSTNGITWTGNSVPLGQWSQVAFGAGLFVACSFDGKIMTSPDGVTWTQQTSGVTNHLWEGIAFGNGIFSCMAPYGNYVQTSPDGITWTLRSNAPGGSNQIQMAFGNGLFVVCNNSAYLVSTDGITYTSYPIPGGIYQSWMNYGNGVFLSSAYFNSTVLTSGYNLQNPSALEFLGIGGRAKGTAPLKFQAGDLLTIPEAGATEFDGGHLYFTPYDGGNRYQLDQAPAILPIQSPGAYGSIITNVFGSGIFAADNNGNAIIETPLAIFQQSSTPGYDADSSSDYIYPKVDDNIYTLNSLGLERRFSFDNDILVTVFSYQILLTDKTILIDTETIQGGFINMPDPTTCNGQVFTIKDWSGGAFLYNEIIYAFGTETFDGQASLTLNTPYQSYTLESDGTNWVIISPVLGESQTKIAISYAVQLTDEIILVDTVGAAATLTITVPNPATCPGRSFVIKDWSGQAGTYNITIAPFLTETFDGVAGLSIVNNYGSFSVTSDGTNWVVTSFGGAALPILDGAYPISGALGGSIVMQNGVVTSITSAS